MRNVQNTLIAVTLICAALATQGASNYTNTLDVTSGGAYPTPVALHQPNYTAWRDNPDYNTWPTYYKINSSCHYPYIIKLLWDTEDNALYMTNLCPGVTYTWAATNADKTVIRSGSFTTVDRAPRWLLAAYKPSVSSPSYVSNFRDLGGWPLMGGGKTRYNVFFRCAKLDGYFLEADRRGNNTLNSEFGIKTELDLRGGNNIVTTNDGNKAVIEDERYYYGTNAYALAQTVGYGPDHTFTNSPCCNDGSMRYFRVTMSSSTPSVGSSTAEENRKAFHVLGTKAYHPVVFHCVGGRDRTGHIAVMIEALCGLSEENIFRDHLSITLAGQGTMYSERVDRSDLYVLYNEKYNKYGPSLAGHTRAWMEAIGVTPEEIAGITEALTGETPDEIIARVDAYEATNHVRTVRFVTDTGTSIITNAIHRVGDGEMLHAPNISLDSHYESYNLIRTGYKLTGWSEESYENPSNSVIMSTWEKLPENPLVIWKDPFGSVLGQTTVAYGSDATEFIPAAPEGTTITGWDKDVTCITEDIVVTCTMTGKDGYLGTRGEELTSGAIKNRGGDKVYCIKGEVSDTYIHVFTNTSKAATFTNDGNDDLNVQYLVVGGGGAGGDTSTSYLGAGGGGGGGGVAGATATMTKGSVWDIYVGAGGTTPHATRTYRGYAGDSAISNGETEVVFAMGGGEGACSSSHLSVGTRIKASCGGYSGRGYGSTENGLFTSSCDRVSYGPFAGGLYQTIIIESTAIKGIPGGGGGAGSDGGTALGAAYQAGHGGLGVYSSITGELKVYGSGGGGGGGFGKTSTESVLGYYAWLTNNVERIRDTGLLAGCGANGGGMGASGYGDDHAAAQAGADGFGGGGGGAGSAALDSANGGSGVVILRYEVHHAAIEINTISSSGNLGNVTYTVYGVADKDDVTGKTYLKPGTIGVLKAVDDGGNYCGCWRDDSTGEIFCGEEVTVKPTQRTTYTAVFGPAWTYDDAEKTLSNGDWTFCTTRSGNSITITVATNSSATASLLNLTTPVVDTEGNATQYSIVKFGADGSSDTGFGKDTTNAHRLKLTGVIFPDTLVRIGKTGFENCKKLTGIVCIPKGVALGKYSFNGCLLLNGVFFKGGAEGGQTFESGGSQFSSCKNLVGDIVIPDGNTTLPAKAFYCAPITSMTLPDSCTTLGTSACSSCTNLTNVVLSPKTTSIGDNCFYKCTKLKKVTPFLPDTLVTLGNQAFYSDSAIEGDLRMASVKNVPYRAFYKCVVSSVWMPSVTNVSSYAFYSASLTNVVFGMEQVHFYYSTNVTINVETGNCTFAKTAYPCRFYFPGKAPDMPLTCIADSQNCFGYCNPFSDNTKGPARLYGSWVNDPKGWAKIFADVGKDLAYAAKKNYDVPTEGLEEVRSVKGFIYYPDDDDHKGLHYAWLYDWKSPTEPKGAIFILR